MCIVDFLIIGVWTHLADSPLAYAENVRALVDVVGIDHVCIGTDTRMTPAYRPAGGFGSKPNQGNPDNLKDKPPHDSNAKNGSGGGEKRGRVGERTNEAWQNQTAGFYYAIVDAMLKTGFTEDEIVKFGGGNFCRIFDAVTAGK